MVLRITCNKAQARLIANLFETQERVTVEYSFTNSGIEVQPMWIEGTAAFLEYCGSVSKKLAFLSTH